MHHVIIGGSIAGISAAKEIRKGDVGAKITVVSEEKTRTYYRPMVPFLIERDEIDITFADDPAKKFGIKNIFEKVTGIDVSSKEVRFSTGTKLGYDKLLIATGSGPIIPDIPGIGGDDVFPLRTMENALEIKSSVKGKRSAVVMGGGFVGTKAAIALKHLGLKVTIIEKMEQILPQRIDRRGSGIISDVMKAAGIEIIVNDSISEIIRDSGAVKSIRLSSGERRGADMVIIAVGAKPNVEVFKDSGIKFNRGILINEFLQTNIPDIYAAGDVVEYVDLITGLPSVSALWTNAEEMGRFAGKNMTGGNIKYRGFLSVMNATDIFNIAVISAGLIEPEGKGYEIFVQDDINSYRKLVFKGDSLAGMVFIGDVTNAGIYTNLIKNRIPLGSLKEEAIKGGLEYIDFVRNAPVQTPMI
jgi:NAD(P)H-nitrite reductase large subunit